MLSFGKLDKQGHQCTWYQHRLSHTTPNLARQPLLTALIRTADLLRKWHVNIFVIYFLAETKQLQQFLRELSDMSDLLAVRGAIDCTHTILLSWHLQMQLAIEVEKSFNFLAMMGLCDAKFQVSMDDRKVHRT